MNDKLEVKKLFTDFVTPQVDEKSKKDFHDKVEKMLNYSFRCKSKISPLLKNEQVFDNSLGDIYLYIKDDDICSLCTKGFSSCPKDSKGYRLSPRFDEDLNAIVCDNVPCEYLKKKDKTMDNIFPRDKSYETIYYQSSLLLKQIRNRENPNQLKDCESLVSSVLSIYGNFQKKIAAKGLAFYSNNSTILSTRMLMFSCYLFASKGIRCSYVLLHELFKCFNDKDYQVKEIAQRDFRILMDVPVLFLENINLFERRFYPQQFLSQYFYPLIKKRCEKGKLTFASLSQDRSLDALANSWFYQMDEQSDVREMMNALFDRKRIKDIPLD